MANEIRSAAARWELAQFALEPPHTRLKVDLMVARQAPLSLWVRWWHRTRITALHEREHVAAQYLRGTDLLLARFAEEEAVHGLNQAVIGLFLAIGALALIITGSNNLGLALAQPY